MGFLKKIFRNVFSDGMTSQHASSSFDQLSDEELEAHLRRELIEIALVNGANDAETLRDILIATRTES